jgi:hypothetical protein
MSVRLLSRIKLALLPRLFQPFARDPLNAGHCGLIIRVDQLQAQALDILIVGALAEHFVGEDLFATP